MLKLPHRYSAGHVLLGAALLAACAGEGRTPDFDAGLDAHVVELDAPADAQSADVALSDAVTNDGSRPDSDADGGVDGGTDGGADATALGAAILEQDVLAASSMGPALARLATDNGVPPAPDGLLGRNREWGALYSPRFQLGAGYALRIALALGDTERARSAFTAVAVAADTIEDDGRVPTRVPMDLGVVPSAGDIASAAAFYLGEACSAMLALDAHRDADGVATMSRRQEVATSLGRGARWLATQRDLLVRADAQAPNRLFYDAHAFQACGVLAADDALFLVANDFVDLARTQYDVTGFFIEGGGSDTSYQAANVIEIREVLLAGHVLRRESLEGQMRDAVTWMSERTSPSGAIDSTDNQRTCGGCESFGPGAPPKEMNVREWLRAMVYGSIFTESDEAVQAKERFSMWVVSAPETSCYARNEMGALEPSDIVAICSAR